LTLKHNFIPSALRQRTQGRPFLGFNAYVARWRSIDGGIVMDFSTSGTESWSIDKPVQVRKCKLLGHERLNDIECAFKNSFTRFSPLLETLNTCSEHEDGCDVHGGSEKQWFQINNALIMLS
jgi:hypothetical protein